MSATIRIENHEAVEADAEHEAADAYTRYRAEVTPTEYDERTLRYEQQALNENWVASLVYGSMTADELVRVCNRISENSADAESYRNMMTVIYIAAIKISKIDQLRGAGNAKMKELLSMVMAAGQIDGEKLGQVLKAATRFHADRIYNIVITPSGMNFLHPAAAGFGRIGQFSFSGGPALLTNRTWQAAKYTLYYLNLVKSADIAWGTRDRGGKQLNPAQVMTFVDAQKAGKDYGEAAIDIPGAQMVGWVASLEELHDLMKTYFSTHGEEHPCFGIPAHLQEVMPYEDRYHFTLSGGKAALKVAKRKYEEKMTIQTEIRRSITQKITEFVGKPDAKQTKELRNLVTAEYRKILGVAAPFGIFAEEEAAEEAAPAE